MARTEADSGRRLLGTLRQRVVASFVVLVGISLLGVGTYVYFQTEHKVMHEVDSSLRVAVSQAIASLAGDGNRLVFQKNASASPQRHVEEGFSLRVLSPAGEQWDGTGQAIEGLPAPPSAGYLIVNASGVHWRILTQPVPGTDGQLQGWIQAARSLQPTEGLLQTLRTQLYLVLPIALVLAAIAGYLLAGRTLRPLVRISQVADAIRPGDFGRRIRYQGPADEIGRLAGAFDRMLDRVEQAFLRERRFTSDASHELRTPLTAMKGGIGVTLSRERTPAEYQAALQDFEGQVDRLIRLSTGLLSVARAGRPRNEEPEIVDLGELLGATIQQVEALAGEKGVPVEMDLPADIFVLGFAEDLARVFLNLLANAISFTSPPGRIRVSGRLVQQGRVTHARMDVMDSGPGIGPDDLPNIFEPFYQGDSSRSREGGGSGLGLTIAREIIMAHGGSLEASSVPGEGSTFSVSLPAFSDRASAGNTSPRRMRRVRHPRRAYGAGS